MRVLDVGCGPEATSAALIARAFGCHVVAVDAAETAAQARQAVAGLDLPIQVEALGNLEDLPTGYDAVLSECTLSLMGPGALPGLRQRLRPGGQLLLSDVTVEGAALDGALAWAACIGGARAQEETLQAVRGAGFRLEWHAARPELIGQVRERIRARVDVEGLAAALGGGLAQAVADVEAAYQAGRIGYLALLARRER
jgi:SAM-dependent methyltransferase